MTKRTAMLSLLCLVAAACGSDNSGNVAASKQFTYGAPTTATSTQTGALQSSLSGMTSLQSSPDAATATSFTEFSDITEALIGDYAFSYAPEAVIAQRKALAKARTAALYSPTSYGTDFDNPGCVTVSASSVQLSGCTITVTETSSSGTATVKVNADGSVTLSNSNQTLKWDLTITVNVSVSGSGGSGSGGGRFHGAGEITVVAPTATAEGTIKGNMTSEVSFNASAGGESMSLRVDESLAIDVTYQTSPSECVTGGTVEAKRVFSDWDVPNMDRPSDRGALVTWTGCGTGTIALSTN